MKILCRYNHVPDDEDDANDLEGMQWGWERERGRDREREREKFGDLKGILLIFMGKYFFIWSECTDLGIRKKIQRNS